MGFLFTFECYQSDSKTLIRSLKKFKKKFFENQKFEKKTKTESVNHTKVFSSPIRNKKNKKNENFHVKIDRVDPEIKWY